MGRLRLREVHDLPQVNQYLRARSKILTLSPRLALCTTVMLFYQAPANDRKRTRGVGLPGCCCLPISEDLSLSLSVNRYLEVLSIQESLTTHVLSLSVPPQPFFHSPSVISPDIFSPNTGSLRAWGVFSTCSVWHMAGVTDCGF